MYLENCEKVSDHRTLEIERSRRSYAVIPVIYCCVSWGQKTSKLKIKVTPPLSLTPNDG
jgi:hypothetical protein